MEIVELIYKDITKALFVHASGVSFVVENLRKKYFL